MFYHSKPLDKTRLRRISFLPLKNNSKELP